MTEILLGIILVLVLGVAIWGLYLFSKLKNPNDSAELKILREQINLLSKQQTDKIDKTRIELDSLLRTQNELLNKQLNESQKSIQQQFAISQRSISETNKLTSQIVKDVTEKMTKLEETNKNVMAFASQLQSLENILKNPKQRGILGEYFLESMLKNVFPPSNFQMQYKFRDGLIVDAVIFVKDKIIPIDSKFSLENYNKIVDEKNEVQRERLEKLFKQDLKNRIEETAKYIRPSENTMDFAFMFIPSEGIYYDLLINQVGAVKVNTRDLIEYAFMEKKVIIVSPTNFLAYLQTVLQGLRALQIEESAQEIMQNVQKLKNHIQAFDENFGKVGKHLGTTVSMYNNAYKEFGKIDKDMMKITGGNIEITALEVDNPSLIE